MVVVATSGRTSATPASRSGQTAPNRWAEAKRCSPHPFLVPDVGDAPLLPDPGLVREPQLDPLRLGVPGGDPADQVGQAALKRACARGSASGWAGLAFCQDRSRLLSKRSMPVSL